MPARHKMQEPIERLERRNLGMEVADRIRHMILDGRFPSGAHIVEADLATTLGVSHGTVRVGLQQLQHEGIVEHRPHHGVFVRHLNSKDVRELYTLRNTLEAMAARLAAGRATDDGRQELRAILKQMRKAVEAGDRSAAISSDFEFHRVVGRLSDHRLLQEHYRLLELKTRLFMVLAEAYHPDSSYLIPLHESLAEAITAGDADRAEALAMQHSNDSGERLIKFLESHPDADTLSSHADLSRRYQANSQALKSKLSELPPSTRQ